MNTVFLGLLFSITASVGFWGSLVFIIHFTRYRHSDKQDALSAKGYVYGYIGSVILVVICLVLIMFVAQTPKQALILTRVKLFIDW